MSDQTPELECLDHTTNSKQYLAQTVLMVLEEQFLDYADGGPTYERFTKDHAEQIEAAFRKSDVLLCAELAKIMKPLIDEIIEEIKQFNLHCGLDR